MSNEHAQNPKELADYMSGLLSGQGVVRPPKSTLIRSDDA